MSVAATNAAGLSVRDIAERSKAASRVLPGISSERRSATLKAVADLLVAQTCEILDANRQDVEEAGELVAAGELSKATLDRLKLTRHKLEEMAHSMAAVAELCDPIGRVLQRTELDTGLMLDRISCPLGVLAVIFEARPDAVTQISALALKSANAVILKPGKEVERTATALVNIIRRGLEANSTPADAVSLVCGRQAVHALLQSADLVDLVIPRGSRQLVEFVQSATRIPVLGHAEGICHIYVDAAADFAMALDIIDDAKTSYPAACNAVETVLVHQAIAQTFLPPLADRMQKRGVRLRGCATTRKILAGHAIETVEDHEWRTEYGDLVLAIRVVADLDAAVEHIRRYGSSHTESIVTSDVNAAERFLQKVDSTGVYHNASTRFADGYRYGFGAEVGISTSKLHARGPVGLEGLTTYKYVLRGAGHTSNWYQGDNARLFKHLPHKL